MSFNAKAPPPSSILALTKRNTTLFFRDRASVFFSLMGALVVLGLYAFILRDSFISGTGLPGAAEVTDLWLVGGLLAIVPVTTTAGSLGLLVSDRYSGRTEDFRASPASAYVLTIGYVLSTFVVGCVMSITTLVLCEAYIVATGAPIIGAVQLMRLLGVLLLSVLSSTSILFFVTSFIWSEGGFSGLSMIIGVMVGFVAGVYVPLGMLPGPVGFACSMLPVTHSAALFRDILAGPSAEEMFSGAPDVQLETFRHDLGYDLYLGDWMFPEWSGVAILAVTAAAFFVLAAFNMNRRRRDG